MATTTRLVVEQRRHEVASDLPVPVPACTSRCRFVTIASATASAISHLTRPLGPAQVLDRSRQHATERAVR